MKYSLTFVYKYEGSAVGNPTLHRLKIFVLIMCARNISGAARLVNNLFGGVHEMVFCFLQTKVG